MDVTTSGTPRTFTPGHWCAYAVPSGECRRRATHWMVYPSGKKVGRCRGHAFISSKHLAPGMFMEEL